MIRKSFIASIVLIGALCTFTSCNDGYSKRLLEERDSLMERTKQQDKQLTKINDVMNTLGQALDSVQAQENILFVNQYGEQINSRESALDNLKRYELVIKAQQKHIAELEDKLRDVDDDQGTNEQNAKLSTLIENLKAQLAEKDNLIEELRTKLESQNVDIAQLKYIVESQKTQISQLDEANQRYSEALVRSTEMANKGFLAIGTKKELEQKGLIKKGKVMTKDIFDKTKFKEVDIRKFTEIKFEAKKPKIITNVPQSSYEMTTDGKGSFSIHIINPTDFWSMSNFLIIQTN